MEKTKLLYKKYKAWNFTLREKILMMSRKVQTRREKHLEEKRPLRTRREILLSNKRTNFLQKLTRKNNLNSKTKMWGIAV